MTSISGKFSKHYENFPVASFLIPSEKRNVIRLVYWFARTADDLADEGEISPEIRIKNLTEFEDEFKNSLSNSSNILFMNRLSKAIQLYKISTEHFFDLLSAFKQDVIKNRYNSFSEIMDYCNRSANPIGRIILEIFNYRSDGLFYLSDRICSSLQLINFIQDTKIDIKKNRLYYPIDEFYSFSIDESDFFNLEYDNRIKQYLKFNVDRARKILNEGKHLIKYLNGRLSLEIKWTISGGEEILNKIERIDYNVLSFRPVLSKLDFIKILLKSLL